VRAAMRSVDGGEGVFARAPGVSFRVAEGGTTPGFRACALHTRSTLPGIGAAGILFGGGTPQPSEPRSSRLFFFGGLGDNEFGAAEAVGSTPPHSPTPNPRPERPHRFSCLVPTGCEPLPGPARSEPGACHACGRPPARPPARGAKRRRRRGVARGIDLTRLLQLHACFGAAVLMERASCAAVPRRGLCQQTRVLPTRPNASV